MTISLTREEFLKRFQERNEQVKFPEAKDLKQPIFKQTRTGKTINTETDLNEIVGIYIKNLINVVYREP